MWNYDLSSNMLRRESVEVPIKGVTGKPPSVAMMGDRLFEWDANNVYRQVQPYVIPLPALQTLSGW
jgi:hypothetical protein